MKIVKEVKEVKEEKKELTEAFHLWKNVSKTGLTYLKGADLHDNKLVGFFNSNKKNPKEPDVRIYEVDSEGKQGEEVASLWESISKKETRYLTGSTNEKEKLIAFYGDKNQEMRPYIRAYFKED